MRPGGEPSSARGPGLPRTRPPALRAWMQPLHRFASLPGAAPSRLVSPEESRRRGTKTLFGNTFSRLEICPRIRSWGFRPSATELLVHGNREPSLVAKVRPLSFHGRRVPVRPAQRPQELRRKALQVRVLHVPVCLLLKKKTAGVAHVNTRTK